MNDQEKSEMLARAMGWSMRHYPTVVIHEGNFNSWTRGSYWLVDESGKKVRIGCRREPGFYPMPEDGPYEEYMDMLNFEALNFYDSANMELAQRIFRWAYPRPSFIKFKDWLDTGGGVDVLVLDDGFRMALDKILQLAIEAGIIEMEGG